MWFDPSGDMSVAWDRDVASLGKQVERSERISAWFATPPGGCSYPYPPMPPTVFTDDGFYYEYDGSRWRSTAEIVIADSLPPGLKFVPSQVFANTELRDMLSMHPDSAETVAEIFEKARTEFERDQDL